MRHHAVRIRLSYHRVAAGKLVEYGHGIAFVTG
jgi:hypothetical protein